MKLEVTLHHKQHSFLGRTYCTLSHELKREDSACYQSIVSEYVLFHTWFPIESFELVAELLVYELSSSGSPLLSTMFSAGWAALPFSKPGKPSSAPLCEGSPRILLVPNAASMIIWHDSIGTPRSEETIEFSVKEMTLNPAAKCLVPAHCLCGPADQVFGLVGDCLPRQVERLMEFSGKEDLRDLVGPSCPLFVNKCVVRVPKGFESRILDAVKKLQQNATISVQEYSLAVGCHNMLAFVNEGKAVKLTVLTLNREVLTCNAPIEITSVPVGKDVGLVFQLAVKVKVVRKGKHDESYRLVLCDLVCFPKYNQTTKSLETFIVDESMNQNNETSLFENSGTWLSPELIEGQGWDMELICEISPLQSGGTGTKRTVTAVSNSENRDPLAKKLPAKNPTDPHHHPTFEEANKVSQAQRDEIDERAQRNKTVDAFLRNEGQKEASAVLTPAKMPPLPYPQSQYYSPGKGLATPVPKSPSGSMVGMSGIYAKPLDASAREFFASPAQSMVDIKEDKLNLLRSSIITIEFLSFRPKGLLLSCEDLVPERVCFSCQFFDQPPTHTSAANVRKEVRSSLGDVVLPLTLGRPVPSWTNAGSVDPEGKVLRLEFLFDPSADPDLRSDEQLEDFLRYLAKNSITIFVWNADGMLPIGSCRLPLCDLLRKKEEEKSVGRDLPVLNEEREEVASLKVNACNIGRKEGSLRPTETGPRSPLKKTRTGKTRVSSKPITLRDLANIKHLAASIPSQSTYGKSFVPSSPEEDDFRKSMIVFGYKLLANSAVYREKKPHAATASKRGVLEDVEKYRTLSRSVVLSALTEPGAAVDLSGLQKVPCSLGQLTILPVKFENKGTKVGKFAVFVHDEEEHDRLQFVFDSNEWKYLCAKEGHEQPPDWSMMSPDGIFALKPKDSVVLLFKVFPLHYPRLKQRGVGIKVVNQEANKLEHSKDFCISFKSTYINGHFLFSKPEGSAVTLTVTPEMHGHNLQMAKYILTSDETVRAALASDSSLQISCTTPSSATSDLEFTLFLFRDLYHYETVCIFSVKICAYQYINIAGPAGRRSVQEIPVTNPGASRRLGIVSSNSRMATTQFGQSACLDMEGHQTRMISLHASPYKIGRSTALIHAYGINPEL